MNNVILLCLSTSDVKNLPTAAASLRAVGTQNIWLMWSPAVVVSLADATAQFDKDLADLEKRKAAAIEREDYEGAKQIKADIEGKQLDRKASIADAYKKVKKEDREARAAEMFKEFYAACGVHVAVKPYQTVEHHDAADLHNLLNLYKDVRPFGNGNYGVVFARAIGQPALPITDYLVTLPKNMGDPTRQLEKPKFDAAKVYTPTELEALHHFSLRSVAMNRGVFVKGMPKEAQIKAILEKDTANALS